MKCVCGRWVGWWVGDKCNVPVKELQQPHKRKISVLFCLARLGSLLIFLFALSMVRGWAGWWWVDCMMGGVWGIVMEWMGYMATSSIMPLDGLDGDRLNHAIGCEKAGPTQDIN